MVDISKRMTKLRTKLLSIRTGPGAAILPPEVKKIQLNFANTNGNGHQGAKKVWREYLPRLKYYNPVVSMVVNRTGDPKRIWSTMTIEFHDPDVPQPAHPPLLEPPTPVTTTALTTKTSVTSRSKIKKKVIRVNNGKSQDILARLLEETNGRPVVESKEDSELRKWLSERMEHRRDTMQKPQKLDEAAKREEELLQQATQEILTEDRDR